MNFSSNFRNGENFVYPTSDWKNHPMKATFYLVVLATASMVFHLIFNVIHGMRKKFHERLVKRINLGKVEETKEKTICMMTVEC